MALDAVCPEPQLATLTACCSFILRCAEHFSAISLVESGHNALRGFHYVSLTSLDRNLGFKSAGPGRTEACEIERIISELACYLSLPGAQQITTVSNVNIGRLNNLPVNVSHWLKNGVALQELLAKEQLNYFESSENSVFFEQLGAWMAFCAVFGIRDRHEGNWIWSENDRILQMIDFENSFESFNAYDLNLVYSLVSSNLGIWNSQTGAILKGFSNCWLDIATHTEDLQEILASSSSNAVKAFKIDLENSAPDVILGQLQLFPDES